MKKMKAIFIACAIVCMSMPLICCGGNGKSHTNGKTQAGSGEIAGWTLNKDKPVSFDWYINFSWFTRHWGDSLVSKYITEKTGVDINFIVPAGNEAEKLNAMIAGDALPDIITLGWWEGQVPMMIDAGLVEPLDELAKKYDPYFFKVANKDRLS